MTPPLWAWAALVGGTIAVIALDLLIISKPGRSMRTRTALIWTCFWVILGIAFGFLIAAAYGSRYATEYWSGFLLEYSLSMDNVFVFIVLFGFFATPAYLRLRVLTVAILIALGMRLVAILIGGVLIERFSWTFYVFGLFLIWTAWRLIKHGDQPAGPDQSRVLRFLRRHLPVTGTYEGTNYLIRRDGRRMITILGLVLIMLAGTDLVFALDSIPAAYGVTSEPFLVFAVNVFALLGLRSLYFVLAGLVDRFVYLSYGLAIVLAFVGAKMLLKDLWHVPTLLSLGVIVVVLTGSIAVSWWSTRKPGDPQPG